ncbi:hypothetical protein [Frigoribacterium sp. UYMn621]|uniref:hypothetical protein n=1 Tax=Frigoribacterium sp. UYMn621 TaxID=3156343 RepID=UPI003396A321
MPLTTEAEAQAIIMSLLTDELTGKPDRDRYAALQGHCAGDDSEETLRNVSLVLAGAISHIAWLLTVAGGQTTAGALNIILQAPLWEQIDEIGRNVDLTNGSEL